MFGIDKFKQLMPPALDRPAGRTRGAGVLQLQGGGEIKFILNSEKDSSMRDECIRCGSVLQ